MSLTLLTGPANAEKAGHVLTAYRAAAHRDALLVVPTFADMEHYRRELAASGAVFGVRVERFAGLVREIGRRAGVGGRAASPVVAERVAAAAVAATPLRALAASAATPGFVAAFLRLANELGEQRIDPGRLHVAMRAWAAAEPQRADYAHELAALYAAYRDGLRRLGRRDAAGQAIAALDALRLDPGSWGGSPVFVYGFDDLTALQRDAVETLARHAGADVTVALTYEPGRTAFRGRGDTFQALLALGAEHVELPARAEHYAPEARAALHHLERALFEPAAERVEAGDAVLLLEGGGARAELELVAAHVARLLRDGGHAPEDVAVVLRRPADTAALLEEVFGAYGVPVAVPRRVRAGHTALGRGVLALLRCTLPGGTADDLLTWLRTPGKLRRPGLADRLEAEARREGVVGAAEARALWERAHPDFPLAELDRVAGAASRGGPAALCERLAAEAGALFAAPWRGAAPVLGGAAALDARVAARMRDALGELAALARRAPELVPGPEELHRLVAALEVQATDPPGPGVVAVTAPQAIRARRVRTLFLCGLQEGAFPAPGPAEPFLGDAERRALNAASGLRLRLREESLDVERLFFYTAVSRPTDRLVLSWHAADEAGEPAVPSLFVADVLDAFDASLWERRERRALGAAGWRDDLAPTAREAARGAALRAAATAGPPPVIAPLRDPAVLGHLRERATWSASALEAWAGCPVRWFVERLLRPEGLVPDPEPMVRGALAHAVLEEALRALSHHGPLTPARLPEAKRLLHDALRRRAGEHRISVKPERLRSHLRRLEADLLRYLEHAAFAGSAFAPAHFELTFGGADDPRPAVPMAGGALRLAGRIDRIDLSPDGTEAIVYDYKGKTAPPQARWRQDGKLQVGLYMLVLRELLGVEPAGGLYQPLGATDPRARGLLRDDADAGLEAVATDRLDPGAFAAVLAEIEEAAAAAVAGIRAGALAPQPRTCAWKGGCAHPAICRCEA